MEKRFETFVLSILELNRQMQRIKALEAQPLGLQANQVMCLYYLGSAREGLTAAQLTGLCREDKAAVSRTLAQLVERGDRLPRVRLKVADTGIGVAPEETPHIFERFYRVDKARSREKGGAGLGLAIVADWIKTMGGEIQVESQLGQGSVFTVTLPAAAGKEAP